MSTATKTETRQWKIGDRVSAHTHSLASVESHNSTGTVIDLAPANGDVIQVKWDAAERPMTYNAKNLANMRYEGSSDEPTQAQYAAFGRYVAALMGSNTEWDSAADYLEQIAETGRHKLGVPLGDDDHLAQWRTVADSLGIEHDGEEEVEEEEAGA